MSGRAATSPGPKEGVYRDAALRVIGEQIEERIDEVSRFRHRRAQFGIAALALVALGSGSVAAYAVASASHSAQHAPVAVLGSPAQISCTDGETGTYFTARFRSTTGSAVDQAALCSLVRARLVADPDRYRTLSPDRAISAAASLIASAGGTHVSVQEATFGEVGSR